MHCHPAQAVASCAAQAKHLVSFGVAYPLMQEVFEGLTPAQIANSTPQAISKMTSSKCSQKAVVCSNKLCSTGDSLVSLCLSLTTHVPSEWRLAHGLWGQTGPLLHLHPKALGHKCNFACARGRTCSSGVFDISKPTFRMVKNY